MTRVIALALSVLVALTGGVLMAAPAVATPAALVVQADSSIGGQITRSEVLARAGNWYARRNDSDMTYSMSAYTWDGPHSRMYRRDCGGMVDMAWHLDADPNTQGLMSSTYTYSISRNQLKPGDLLDDVSDSESGYPYHAILFGGWENSQKSSFWYYSFGDTPMALVRGASFSDSTLSGHPTSEYQARRYRKIVDNPTQAPDLLRKLSVGANADGRLQAFQVRSGGTVNSTWQTSANGVFGPWANLGGTQLRNITTNRTKDGRMELFAIGGDSKLYHKWQTTPNGPFSDWTSLGGDDLTTDLTIATNADGRLQAFVIGGNGTLYSIWQTTTSGPWSAWANLGGTDLHAVTATTKTDGRIELFAIGGDSKLYHKWQNTANGPFSDWANLGGNDLTTDLTVATNADGRLQVFVVGGNGTLYSIWQTTTSGPWSAWANVGGSDLSAVSASATKDGRIEVFAIGGDSKLYHKWQSTANGPFTDWTGHGGSDLTTDLAVASNADGRLQVFVVGGNGSLYTISQQTSGTWSAWANLG
ncbi:hypothetical protein [Micromonospora sp. NPDC048839]|uniref:hypothetical protein n=1 Tax=Micromonospora sp. NPDC048839 TaxID=3155641 RepID=UPI0033D416E5